MIRHPWMLAAFAAVTLAIATGAAQAQPYFYVGPSGGDFFDELNWNTAANGSGSFLAGDPLMDDAANGIDVDLVMDGVSVVANGQVDFGIGSLTMLNGAMFEVAGSGNDLDLNDDTVTSITDSSLIVDDFIQLGGMVTLSGASLSASDDINFLGTASISNTVVESTGDDIEFRDSATILSVTGSDFLASSLGTDGSFNQSVIFQTNVTASDSSFTGGQLGFDGDVAADLTVTDSVITFTGDINNVFSASGTPALHRIFLQGNTTLAADQIEDGTLLAVQDSSHATFIDDDDDDDADGLPDTWIITNALVRLDSYEAGLTFLNPGEIDVRSRVFDGLTPTTYALTPSAFAPSDWDGLSAVTLRLVPEPTAAAIAALACVAAVSTRRKSA